MGINSAQKYDFFNGLQAAGYPFWNEYAATVPGAFIVPEWDFMYLFEVMDKKNSGKTYPDMETEMPYVVVQLER